MKVKHGDGPTKYGPGVEVKLKAAEVYDAIMAYLVARGVSVSGPHTVTVNGERIQGGKVYIDPSGFVIRKGKKISGRGKNAHDDD